MRPGDRVKHVALPKTGKIEAVEGRRATVRWNGQIKLESLPKTRIKKVI